ncbi:uracil-DNA glycosylase family protein [Luteococcus peritonei]
MLRLADSARSLEQLDARVAVCRACPRLVDWREQVARAKRASYAGEPYWGRPVPGWGDPEPHSLIVGLAPAANGANRTGRIFTGDRSGDWLYAALHRVGLANQPTSVHAADGLQLTGVRITAPVHCAPPDNAPTTPEKATCAPWLDREIQLVEPGLRSMLALGGIGWQQTLGAVRRLGWSVPRPAPRFGHGAEAVLVTPSGREVRLLGCYHVSQQNTFTGRLTEEMLDEVLTRL